MPLGCATCWGERSGTATGALLRAGFSIFIRSPLVFCAPSAFVWAVRKRPRSWSRQHPVVSGSSRCGLLQVPDVFEASRFSSANGHRLSASPCAHSPRPNTRQLLFRARALKRGRLAAHKAVRPIARAADYVSGGCRPRQARREWARAWFSCGQPFRPFLPLGVGLYSAPSFVGQRIP